MADEQSNVMEEEEVGVVGPWTIEADHPRNADLHLQGIPGAKLRSAIDGTKPLIDAKTGELRVPTDQAIHLASFPRTPGQRLWVDPEEGIYKITDPLTPAHLDAIKRFFKSKQNMTVDEDLKGVPDQKGKLDPHRMKTLCREMLQLVEAGEARHVSGALPTLDDIAALGGKYLLNPGARVRNTQPQYEEDFPAWVANLDRMGG